MCKSKKKLINEVIEPKPKPKRSNSPSPSPATEPAKKSSSFDRSTSTTSQDFISTTGSTTSFINKKFKGFQSENEVSSHSSQKSLSTLREVLLTEQPHIYNFSEIRIATKNFHQQPFSSSSTSTSWRCVLRGQNVVVTQRKFRRRPMETPELVDHVAMICRSHHSSLIPLKGASISGNYIYLVYEYIHGVNLSEALRNPRNQNFTVLSNWMSRIQIASDIVHGLDYIHNSTGLGLDFVHNHIKSTSIIVTEQPSLNAKICHFGAAELCGEIAKEAHESNLENGSDNRIDLKKCGSNVFKFEGTRGYMAPELFQWTGIATQKSDVYAFGVSVLELISGNEALKYCFDDESGEYMSVSVIASAHATVDGGAWLRGWVDKRLKDSYPMDVAEKLVRLGLECVDDDPIIRPDMSRVTVRVSQLYLESQMWAEKFAPPIDFTVTLAPR